MSTTAPFGTWPSPITPGTITSGFNMMLLPKLLDRENMLLMITLSMSSKPTFKEFESNGSKVQNADYDTKNAAPKVRLRSGETLVLTGFDENSENASKSGVGSPSFFGLGGGSSRTSTHSALVVLVTPIVLPDNLNGSIQVVPNILQAAANLAANDAGHGTQVPCSAKQRACWTF